MSILKYFPTWKMRGGERSLKIQENRTKTIQINSFLKICPINCFKIWLISIILADRCVPFSPTLPRKLLPEPPDFLLCQDISRFWKFCKEFLVFSISLEEVVIIIKFVIKRYKETTPLWYLFAIFNYGSSQPRSPCNILEKSFLLYRGSLDLRRKL